MRGRIRVGIIGCGAITYIAHMPALRRIPNVIVEYLCDLNVERAEFLAKKLSLNNSKITSNYDEVIEDANIDAVIVATPPHTHYEIIVKAIKGGKHIFCEKPVTLDESEALSILNILRKRGDIKFMVGFNFRFAPQFAEIKELIEEGFIGQPLFMVSIFSSDITNWPTVTKFQLTRGKGGVFFDTGIHHIDLVRWYLGEVKEVFAEMLKINNYDVDNLAVAHLKTQKDAIATLNISWCGPSIHEVKVIGKKASLSADVYSPVIYFTKSYFTPPRTLVKTLNKSIVNSYVYELQHFIDCILNNRNPSPSIEDGYKALVIVKKAYESAETGKVINIRYGSD
jgi:predicted dehydrogenase